MNEEQKNRMKPPTYFTRRFVLQAYQKTPYSEQRFVEMGTDSAVVQFMDGATGDKEAEHQLFQKIFNLYKQKQGSRWFWIWGIYEGKKLCGHLELKETEHTNEHELEIVYMTHPAERNRGLMTEVLAFMKVQQAAWKKQLIATVYINNITSISLLKKWGIVRQEILTDNSRTYLKLHLSC